MAAILDNLNLLLWSKTKDAQHKRNKPKSVLEGITKKPKKQSNIVAFDTGADFDKARAKLLEKVKKNRGEV